MRQLKLIKVFTLIESGPVILVTTHDRERDSIMTISWTMVVNFTPIFAITTGEWNHSFTNLLISAGQPLGNLASDQSSPVPAHSDR